MKTITTSKIALLLAFFLIAASSFSFAGTTNDLTPALKTSFRRDFKNANLLGTERHDKIVKVTFSMDNTVLWAYYSVSGKLLGVVHNILSSELPEILQKELKDGYAGYWITELFELNGDAGSYYVSLENANEVLNLRSTADHGWEIYSRVKKS